VRGDAQDADPAAGVFDHRQDVHPGSGQRHGLDESPRPAARGPGNVGSPSRWWRLGRVPRRSRPRAGSPRRWTGDLDPEREQFAMHPPGVLPRQAQYQGPDRAQRAGPAAPPGPRQRGVAARDQVAVPLEDRVGPDQQPQASQGRLGSGRSSAASQARSTGSNRTCCPSSWRCNTASWWRNDRINDRISMSLSRSPLGSSHSNVNALVMPRYASRSCTSRRHRVVIGDDGYGKTPSIRPRSGPHIKRARDVHGCLSRQVQRHQVRGRPSRTADIDSRRHKHLARDRYRGGGAPRRQRRHRDLCSTGCRRPAQWRLASQSSTCQHRAVPCPTQTSPAAETRPGVTVVPPA
jgi:hypothetical protein